MNRYRCLYKFFYVKLIGQIYNFLPNDLWPIRSNLTSKAKMKPVFKPIFKTKHKQSVIPDSGLIASKAPLLCMVELSAFSLWFPLSSCVHLILLYWGQFCFFLQFSPLKDLPKPHRHLPSPQNSFSLSLA